MADERRYLKTIYFREGYRGKGPLPKKIVPPKGPAASEPVPKKQKSAKAS